MSEERWEGSVSGWMMGPKVLWDVGVIWPVVAAAWWLGALGILGED